MNNKIEVIGVDVGNGYTKTVSTEFVSATRDWGEEVPRKVKFCPRAFPGVVIPLQFRQGQGSGRFRHSSGRSLSWFFLLRPCNISLRIQLTCL